MKKNIMLEETFCRYEHVVFLYALSLCKDVEMAHVLVSDTFYKALLSLSGEKRSVKAWLFKVCRNTFIDNFRNNQRKGTEALPENHPAANGDPLEMFIEGERRRYLYKAVCSLPQPYRECIYLHYYSELSLSEIAELLSITPGNIRTILCRARQKLKKEMIDNELFRNF